MRKTLLFTCVLILCTISSCSHKLKISKVPEKVKSSFYQKFPDAKDVNWEKKNDMYEVEIEMGKKEAVVLFSADGTYIAQQFDVDKNDVICICLSDFKALRQTTSSKIEKIDQQVTLQRIAEKYQLSEQDILTLLKH